MVHGCRCGGNFVLAKDEFDDLNRILAEEYNLDSTLNCELANENCECHEIIEVECETCSLIVGVKMLNST